MTHDEVLLLDARDPLAARLDHVLGERNASETRRMHRGWTRRLRAVDEELLAGAMLAGADDMLGFYSQPSLT